MDLVMLPRASCMKVFSQVSSRESLAVTMASRTWNSWNLCRVEICGGRGTEVQGQAWSGRRWGQGEEAGGEDHKWTHSARGPITTW